MRYVLHDVCLNGQLQMCPKWACTSSHLNMVLLPCTSPAVLNREWSLLLWGCNRCEPLPFSPSYKSWTRDGWSTFAKGSWPAWIRKAGHRSKFDHEAIIGSTKEAEEFDQLPPEEAKRKLRVLMQEMDLNGDKFIERSKLKAWIMRSFRTLSEESKNQFQEADANEDGRVTWWPGKLFSVFCALNDRFMVELWTVLRFS